MDINQNECPEVKHLSHQLDSLKSPSQALKDPVESTRSPEKPTLNAQDLFRFSRTRRATPELTYDLSKDPDPRRAMLWLEDHLPVGPTSCPGITYIIMFSPSATEADKTMFKNQTQRGERALADWQATLTKEGSVINWGTLRRLSRDHGIQGGKWLIHTSPDMINSLWERIASALFLDVLPSSCFGIGVTTSEAQKAKGAKVAGTDDCLHVLSLWNNNWQDEAAILAIEVALRRASRFYRSIHYKPDVFSAIGIFRNNVWNIRPIIYSSRGSGPFRTHVTFVADRLWSYEVPKAERASDERTVDGNNNLPDTQERTSKQSE